MNPKEILELFRTREFRAFKWFIVAGVVIVVGSTAYNKYITNKVLSQQGKINRYILKSWKDKYPEAVQEVVEESPAFS